jgi:putative FmdB family regulatory protein
MPTYDYICKNCHHEFEKFQSITAEPVRVCPVCGEETVIRKITGGAGISFKGSGFYITDYKNSGSKSAAVNSKNDNGSVKKEEKK